MCAFKASGVFQLVFGLAWTVDGRLRILKEEALLFDLERCASWMACTKQQAMIEIPQNDDFHIDILACIEMPSLSWILDHGGVCCGKEHENTASTHFTRL